MPTTHGNTVIAEATLTVSTSVRTMSNFSFTADQLTAAMWARITNGAGAVMYRCSGSNPTASDGHYLGVADSHDLYGANAISNLKFIRTGLIDGLVCITLFG